MPGQTEENRTTVQETADRPAAQKRIPTAVLIIAGVLVAVLVIAAVLLAAMRRLAAEEPDEEQLDWQEAETMKAAPARNRRAERPAEEHRAEALKRRSAAASRPAGKKESDGGYQPRH